MLTTETFNVIAQTGKLYDIISHFWKQGRTKYLKSQITKLELSNN